MLRWHNHSELLERVAGFDRLLLVGYELVEADGEPSVVRELNGNYPQLSLRAQQTSSESGSKNGDAGRRKHFGSSTVERRRSA